MLWEHEIPGSNPGAPTTTQEGLPIMLPVLAIIAVITVLVVLAFRWFERYRYTDAWRTSEFRGAAFGFLMWFGGIFGHRVPPPPQARMELTTRTGEPEPPGLGGATLPDKAADDKQ
jgi:hypothetical protein